jgi:hypothetical protein
MVDSSDEENIATSNSKCIKLPRHAVLLLSTVKYNRWLMIATTNINNISKDTLQRMKKRVNVKLNIFLIFSF